LATHQRQDGSVEKTSSRFAVRNHRAMCPGLITFTYLPKRSGRSEADLSLSATGMNRKNSRRRPPACHPRTERVRQKRTQRHDPEGDNSCLTKTLTDTAKQSRKMASAAGRQQHPAGCASFTPIQTRRRNSGELGEGVRAAVPARLDNRSRCQR